jgi:hypothetical protein
MRRASTNNKRDVLHYDDVQPGDQLTIILTASLSQTVPGEYEFHSQSQAAFEPPPGQKVNIQR